MNRLWRAPSGWRLRSTVPLICTPSHAGWQIPFGPKFVEARPDALLRSTRDSLTAVARWGMRLYVLLASFSLAVLVAQTPEHYYRTFGHDNPVFARIKAGDVVVTKTLDSRGKNFRSEQSSPIENALTGPFYIEGAEPGDAILVTLRKVRLNRNWGFTAPRLGLYALLPNVLKRVSRDLAPPGRDSAMVWDLDLEHNMVRLHEPVSEKAKLEFPARPMLGCVGVAAPGSSAPRSGEAGNYGGNMDYNEVAEGATVILPVYHLGALLYIGDGYALMGDGEPTGTGVETSMDVEFSVAVQKEARLTGPRLETVEYLISVGSQPEFASSLNRALQLATTDMVRWLTADYRLEPWAADQLIGAVGKYDVVTVAGSMALKIPKKYLLTP
jgi:amidase